MNFFTRIIFAILTFITFEKHLSANSLILPRSLSEEALSESVPTAFAPSNFDDADFLVQWHGPTLSGVEVKLAEKSIQWVRISEVLVLPRARLILDAEGVEGGEVSSSGYHQVFSIGIKSGDRKSGHAEIPIALLSGEHNLIQVAIRRGGEILKGNLQIRFQPKNHREEQSFVSVDPSCSPYHLTLDLRNQQSEYWAYLGCRLVRVLKDGNSIPSLEVLIYWDNVGEKIRMDGIETDSTLPSLWPLRLGSEPGRIRLGARNEEWSLSYQIPKRIYSTQVSLGVGPYAYSFRGDGKDSNSIVPLTTLYGSYFLTETFRIVGFGVYTFEEHKYSDLGLYLYIENARLLDRRLGLNLLIGGHGIGFQALNQYYFTFTLPQGFELVYTDAFSRGKNLRLGAFIYPPISNNSYYNVWLRWGASTFVEINYIAWQVQTNASIFNSSTLGASVGFPLFQF